MNVAKMTEWLNESIFVDIYGRSYNLSDVPMTYMKRKDAFKKLRLSNREINKLFKEEANVKEKA